MNDQPSAVNNLRRLSDRLLKITIGIIVMGIAVGALLMLLSREQVKKVKSLEIELASISESQLSTAGLQQFIAANQTDINQLQELFPNQDTIITFLATVEKQIQQIDPEGTVKFGALTPAKVNQELAIPLVITFRGTPAQAVELLKQIETLPYIINITNVEFKLPDSQFAPGEIVFGGRVYVQDPFNQP